MTLLSPTTVGMLAGTGFGICLCGGVASLVWRRDGLTVAVVLWAGSDVAAHPERYVRPDRVATVRALFLGGMALILAAVVGLVLMTVPGRR